MQNAYFNSAKIQNILFDLGGVLLNVDYHKTAQAFIDLGLKDFDKIYSQAKQSGLFDSFEVGEINKNTFLDNLQSKFEIRPEKEAIIGAWNAMLGDFPKHHWEMLLELKNSFGIYLLSNTNEIHFDAFNEIIREQHGSMFSSLFDKDYYSHQIGLRKPNKEVFDYVFAQHGLKKSDTLFIDDSIQHIEGAQQAGYLAVHIESGKDVRDLLRNLSILT